MTFCTAAENVKHVSVVLVNFSSRCKENDYVVSVEVMSSIFPRTLQFAMKGLSYKAVFWWSVFYHIFSAHKVSYSSFNIKKVIKQKNVRQAIDENSGDQSHQMR